MTGRLLKALGVSEPSGLISVIYAPSMDRTRIASLAPVVIEAAEDDPTITSDLLGPSGIDLGITAEAVARSLGWTGGALPLAIAGSFLLKADAIQASLLAYLRGRGYHPEPMLVDNPVEGALILATRRFADEDSRSIG